MTGDPSGRLVGYPTSMMRPPFVVRQHHELARERGPTRPFAPGGNAEAHLLPEVGFDDGPFGVEGNLQDGTESRAGGHRVACRGCAGPAHPMAGVRYSNLGYLELDVLQIRSPSGRIDFNSKTGPVGKGESSRRCRGVWLQP